jgi:hypothetical protein
MVDFESYWDRASGRMDAIVDGKLADRLRYQSGGLWLGDPAVADADRTIPGFVIDANDTVNIDEIDEALGNRKRLKVAKAILPLPAKTDKIQHPRLGAGWFRPGGALPQTEGRYWVFDVQETGA